MEYSMYCRTIYSIFQEHHLLISVDITIDKVGSAGRHDDLNHTTPLRHLLSASPSLSLTPD